MSRQAQACGSEELNTATTQLESSGLQLVVTAGLRLAAQNSDGPSIDETSFVLELSTRRNRGLAPGG
jgi:hypothetical protein